MNWIEKNSSAYAFTVEKPLPHFYHRQQKLRLFFVLGERQSIDYPLVNPVVQIGDHLIP